MIINLILHPCSLFKQSMYMALCHFGFKKLTCSRCSDNFNNKKDKSKKNYYHITVLVKQFLCFNAFKRFIAPYKGIQDSLGFWIPRRGFQIPGTGFQSLSVELGFWIPIFRRIPDSTSTFSQIPDSTSQNFLHSGIRNPLHGASFKCPCQPYLITLKFSLI